MIVHVMQLGWGGQITVGQCVRIVRHAKTQPTQDFSRSFRGWWPVDYREILRQFRDGVNDRINRHLPAVKEWSADKIARAAYRHGLRSECRWCGRGLDLWTADRNRHFCDGDCRCFYYS